MRRSIAVAVVVQGGGTALSLLVVLVIARTLGANAQGEYALLKNWTDLLPAILMFGAPQGIVYSINKKQSSAENCLKVAQIYSLSTIPAFVVVALLGYAVGYLPITEVPLAIAFGVAGAGYVYHGLARSAYLTRRDDYRFSLLTVTPISGLAVLIVLAIILDERRLELPFIINGILIGIAAFALAKSENMTGGRSNKAAWMTFMNGQSVHSFFQSILTALLPSSAFIFLKLSHSGNSAVGILNLALLPLVALNALIGMISPILYNHWSKVLDAQSSQGVLQSVGKIAIGAGAVAGMGMFLGAPLTPFLVGRGFAEAIFLIQILSFALPAIIYTRLALPALLASGLSALGTVFTASRLLMMVAMLSLGLASEWTPVNVAAAAWAASEIFSAMILYQVLRLRRTESVRLPL